MIETRTRVLAAVATALGLMAGGFEAHLAPQTTGWWHGVTGSPSLLRAGASLLAAALVLRLGASLDVRPFLGMAAGGLPLVPALTGLGPAFLVFSGDTMFLLFAILLGVTSRERLSRMPAIEPLAVMILAFSFFILVGRFLPGPAGPQGDEPHYLLIAESLLQDRDLDLKNQFEERAYSKFTGARLEPHTAPRSPGGRLFALHTPGLSALVAPGYAVAGFAGARAVVSAVMAVAVGLLYVSSKALLGPQAAGFLFLLTTFASPLPIYANSLYPDSVATLPVAAVIAAMVAPGPALLAMACAAVAALPWLHPRFFPLALALAFFLAMRDGFRVRRILGAFGPLLVSLGLLLAHFHSLFGRWSLSAAYGSGFSTDVSPFRIPWGASALVLDRQFGLLLFAPVLVLGLRGAAGLWRRDLSVALLTLTIIALGLGVGGSFSMWWGGASPPARFLVGAMPALLLFAAASWKASESNSPVRWLLGGASGFGLGLLGLACMAPRALHNRMDGGSALLRLLSPLLDLDRFFPGFVTSSSVWLALPWAMVLGCAILWPRLGLLAGALLIGLATLTSSSPTRLLDPFSSSLHALESWNDHRRTFGGEDSSSAFTLQIPLGAPSWDLSTGARLYSPRFSLPSGRWTLRVESRSEAEPGAANLARLSVVVPAEDETALASVMIRADATVASADFELERNEQRVNLRADGLQSRATILSVRLVPRP